MRILDRYIGHRILLNTFIATLILVILVAFLTFVQELEEVGTGYYSTKDAFIFSMLSMISYIFEVFPVAALLGCLTALGSLASGSELTAIRSAGVSTYRLLWIIFKSGIIMIIIAFIIGDLVAPKANMAATALRTEKMKKQVVLNDNYGFWAKDQKYFINIEEISLGQRLANISIYEFDKNQQLVVSTHAESAKFDGARWYLYGIRKSIIEADQVKTVYTKKAEWESFIDPTLIGYFAVKPNILPISNLYEYIRFLHKNNQKSTLYEVAFWSKALTPIAVLVMLSICLPLTLGNLRSIGISQRILVGTLAGTSFYLLNRLFAYLAVIYQIQPLLAAMLPISLFSLASYWLIKRQA